MHKKPGIKWTELIKVQFPRIAADVCVTCDNRATFQTSFLSVERKKIRLNALIRQIKASCVLSRAYCKLFLTRLKAKITAVITLK